MEERFVVVAKVKYYYDNMEFTDRYFDIVKDVKEFYDRLYEKYRDEVQEVKFAFADTMQEDIDMEELEYLKRLLNSL
jgi:hypothetical protein